jgi:hypothetical protein
MIVRCEYCGQLYEGLSCPYCCAPRGESEERDGVSNDDCPEWILTNSSCIGDNNVQVIGDNNVVNALYADDMLYYVDHDVWPEDEPSEHETIDATCGTCTHDAQVRSQVKELAEEQAKKRDRGTLGESIIIIIFAWLGPFSLGVLIGIPIGLSIIAATIFCTAIGCCLAMGEMYDV